MMNESVSGEYYYKNIGFIHGLYPAMLIVRSRMGNAILSTED